MVTRMSKTREVYLRNKRLRKRKFIKSLLVTGFLMVVIIAVGFILKNYGSGFFENTKTEIKQTLSNGAVIKKEYLTPNRYSRPQTKLRRIRGIVIHYTANPGTSAKANRSYFEGLSSKGTTYASSHYIIGLKGEVIQCVPLTEIAYASNNRNNDTISIEVCHEDSTGVFNEETYESLVALSAAISVEFNLKNEDIIRHYDVTGKLCPLYYVENEEAWITLKSDIEQEVKRIKQTINN